MICLFETSDFGLIAYSKKSPVVLEMLDLVAVISGQPAMPSGGMWHPWMLRSWATFDPSPQEETEMRPLMISRNLSTIEFPSWDSR